MNASNRTSAPDPARVQVGASDLEVFPLNLGGNTFGWTADKATSFEILDAYREAGGIFVDTADVYSRWGEGLSGGESEQVIGAWLAERGCADEVVVATKVGKLPPNDTVTAAAVTAGCEDSLRRLGLETIPLYYLHADDPQVPVEDQVEAMAGLVEAGKIRHVGLSNYPADRMREFFRVSRGTPAFPVAVQPHYNLLHRAEYETQLRPVVEQYRPGVFPYFALASGVLTGKYRSAADVAGTARSRFTEGTVTPEALRVVARLEQVAAMHDVEVPTVALAWLRAKGATAPIASVSGTGQLDALVAVAGLQLSPAEVTSLDAVSDPYA